jgi:multidrug efflux pump subunit AcrB
LKAFNSKIVPILLTVLSTALGLVPFLLDNRLDAFWRSLVTGTIGGLLFSVVAIYFFLPLFLLRKKDVISRRVLKV